MAYSAICYRLHSHYHFDIGNPTASILPSLSGTQCLDSTMDQSKSVIDRSMAISSVLSAEWRKEGKTTVSEQHLYSLNKQHTC